MEKKDGNTIYPTVLGGWKGSLVMATVSLILFILDMFISPSFSSLGFLYGFLGFTGWAIQEKHHSEGKVIIKRG